MNQMDWEEKDAQLPLTYADLEIITEIGSEVLSTLSLDTVLKTSIEKIVNKCNLLGGILFLVESDYLYAKTIAGDRGASKFLQLIGQPVSNLKIKLAEHEGNSVVKSVVTQKEQFSFKLQDFTRGVLSPRMTQIAKIITHTEACLAIPIIHRGKSIGALFFSKSTKVDFADQLPLLHLLSNHLGIAIVNAEYYEEMQELSSELKERNRELRSALDAITEMRRQEKDMIDVMGHELKTPITSVYAILQIMQRQAEKGQVETEQFSKYINLAIESTQREVALVETMLSATKVESSKIEFNYERFNLLEILDHNIASYQATTLQRKLKIHYQKPQGNFMVWADKVRTTEIIENLLSNAVKYTPQGRIDIWLEKSPDFIKVSVKDTGLGISQEDVKNLGKKFFRAKNSTTNDSVASPSGTGLGLYVVFALVKGMGGKVSVESKPGKGSKFSFTLPRSR